MYRHMSNIRPSVYLSRYGYHPKNLPDDAPRREILTRAVANLARERYGNDAAAAAKRTARHVGHIASYLTHRSPAVSARMRADQRWLKQEYYPATALNIARAVGRHAARRGPRAAVDALHYGHALLFPTSFGMQFAIKGGRVLSVEPLLRMYERYVNARRGRLPDAEAVEVAVAWDNAWRKEANRAATTAKTKKMAAKRKTGGKKTG